MISESEAQRLANELSQDPAARLRFIASTVEYLQKLGVEITPEIASQLHPDNLGTLARGGITASTNVAVTVGRSGD